MNWLYRWWRSIFHGECRACHIRRIDWARHSSCMVCPCCGLTGSFKCDIHSEAMSELPEILVDASLILEGWPDLGYSVNSMGTLAEWRELARAILAVPETGKEGE